MVVWWLLVADLVAKMVMMLLLLVLAVYKREGGENVERESLEVYLVENAFAIYLAEISPSKATFAKSRLGLVKDN